MNNVDTGPTAEAKAGLPLVAVRRPHRASGALKLNFWLDSVLLVAFLAEQGFGLTGTVLHEWIGIGFAVALLFHITLHWNWIIRTTKNLTRKPAGRDTIRWANNLFLVFAMTLTVTSGVL